MVANAQGWKPGKADKFLNETVLGYDQVVLTGHAQDQMEIREISEMDVVKTLKSPTKTGLATEPGRQRIRRNKTARVAIDVVYMETEGQLRVITAIKVTRRIVER